MYCPQITHPQMTSLSQLHGAYMHQRQGLISNTKLCFAVHQITCNNCKQQCIGSTTRFIHDRIRIHLNNENSSVKKHISSFQNKDYKGIEIKTIVHENDPANLRLFEAFYIRKYKPALDSCEQFSEFAHLLF